MDKDKPGLAELLRLISSTIATSPKVKWLVSSRNRPDTELQVRTEEDRITLDLELNAPCISNAVNTYIGHKLSEITREKQYGEDIQAQIADELREKAEDTFLWVSLVCKMLKSMPSYYAIDILRGMPSGLKELYDHMMSQIKQLDLKDLDICKRVLSVMTLAYRPLHLSELVSLARLPTRVHLLEIIRKCVSFLTIRDNTIYLVHQSAKDYLSTHAEPEIFPHGRAEIHCEIISRSLRVLSDTLQRDIYGLRDPGTPIDHAKSMGPDPLTRIRYACVYWIDHLCQIDSNSHDQVGLCDGGGIYKFLRTRFLHWLEALSLMRSMSNGVTMLRKLENLLIANPNNARDFLPIIRDANRFILSNRGIIETAPLQVYASALIFSPAHSLTRELFREEEPRWVTTKPVVESNWSPCLQTLEGHSGCVKAVAFSHDERQLASGSRDKTVRIWDGETGAVQQTLEGHISCVNSVAFSHDGRWLASGSDDKTVRIWDSETGVLQHTLEGHKNSVYAVTFLHDSCWLMSVSADMIVQTWDAETGMLQWTLEFPTTRADIVVFSHNKRQLASGSRDKKVRIYDLETGTLQWMLGDHMGRVEAVAFSHDGSQLASGSQDWIVRIWDGKTGTLQQMLGGHTDCIMSLAFSYDGRRLASASRDSMVRIWDVETGMLQQTLESHTEWVYSIVFSHDGRRLMSGSRDKTVRIWDGEMGKLQQTLEGHKSLVNVMAFSHDRRWLASGSYDNTVRIWDSETGALRQTLEGHISWVNSIAFSHNGRQLASGSIDATVRTWDFKTGALQQTLRGHRSWVNAVVFSHDGRRLASASLDATVRIWDSKTGMLQHTLEGHTNRVNAVTFSPDGCWLASAAHDNTVRIWDVETGALQQMLEGHMAWVYAVAFSHDSHRLASASRDMTVRIWDSETGVLQQTCTIGVPFAELSFDLDDSRLITETGPIILDQSSHTLKEHEWSGYGLSSDRSWITWSGKNVLWLPPEYRPSSSTVRETSIAIGCPSYKVIIFRFSSNIYPIS